MAERLNAAVLKTVEGHTSGGSNPSFSAKETHNFLVVGFFIDLNGSRLQSWKSEKSIKKPASTSGEA